MLTLDLEVLCHQTSDVDAALSCLRVVSILEVQGSHAVQPSLSQLRRVAVGLGQAVVQVYQLLMVALVDLEGAGEREGASETLS